MIKKTKDYDIFILRDDNREKIDRPHIQRLCESIKSRNLLEFRPIVVNEKMEVIDGQHRLFAAKALDVEIYYQVESKLDAPDIVRMNISKAWTMGDYLNFYCQHDYEEYKKLAEFMKKHSLTLKVALTIALGQSKLGYYEFKRGEFKFEECSENVDLDICWETIHYIQKINGYAQYTYTNRFWKAMLKLVKHPNFDAKKWKSNVEKLVSNFCPKARADDYVIMVQNIYNWRNNAKIHLLDDQIRNME